MPATLAALLALCAPDVDPTTAHALVMHESGGRPWAIGVNGARLSRQPATRAEAILVAKKLTSAGYSVDVGYGQINSNTLRRLGMSIEQGFEPCSNLHAMQTILGQAYKAAAARLGEGQPALRAALSSYNSGNETDGLRSGYVRRVYAQAARPK